MAYPTFSFDGQQIQKIVEDENKVPGLKVFTERLRSCILEMGCGRRRSQCPMHNRELLDTLRVADLLEPSNGFLASRQSVVCLKYCESKVSISGVGERLS